MFDQTMIIFLRNEKEKINKNLLHVCKNNKINFLFLNFGKELNFKSKKLINVKSKYMNKILERIAFKKNHEQFLFINIQSYCFILIIQNQELSSFILSFTFCC